MKQFLTEEERIILKQTHLSTKEKRSAYYEVTRFCEAGSYKINAILLLDKGLNFYQVADALLTDVSTVYRYLNIYQNKGLESLLSDNYKGGTGKLTKEQESQLKALLQQHIYPDSKSVVKYIEDTFGITYTERRFGSSSASIRLCL